MRAIKASLVILFLLLAVYPANAQDFDFEGNMSKGKVALDSGQYELAIKYLEPCEKFASQDTTKEAQEFDNKMLRILANSHAKLENYKKAIELGMRELSIQRQLFDESHPDYATTLTNIAGYYYYSGDNAKAVEFCTQAMEIRKELFGESHPVYAASLNNLAGYYSELGDYTKAVELGTQAMKIRKEVLGESHPDYAASLNNLADYYYDLGDCTKAVELGTQAMGIFKHIFGESHPVYATSLNNLAL